LLFCAKIGCLSTGGEAYFIAGGGAFDSVLETAGREKKFIPMFPLPFFLFSPSLSPPLPFPFGDWGKGVPKGAGEGSI